MSDEELKERRLAELEVLKRDYPKELIKNGILKAKKIPLKELRNPNNNTNITETIPNSDDKFHCIMHVAEGLKNLRVSGIFWNTKIAISHRQPPNLKKLLTSAKLQPNTIIGVKKSEDMKFKLFDDNIEGTTFQFRN